MPDTGSLRLEPVGKRHRRDAFDSGEPPLDEYLRRYARQNHELGIATTFVAVRGDGAAVLGFFTLRAGAVACDDLPEEERRRMPRYPVPVVHLARLAVDHRAAGHGIGTWLLLRAFEKVLDVSAHVGVLGVEVIAKTAAAKTFYEKYGFRRLEDDPLRLYLSVASIRAAFRDGAR